MQQGSQQDKFLEITLVLPPEHPLAKELVRRGDDFKRIIIRDLLRYYEIVRQLESTVKYSPILSLDEDRAVRDALRIANSHKMITQGGIIDEIGRVFLAEKLHETYNVDLDSLCADLLKLSNVQLTALIDVMERELHEQSQSSTNS